MGRISMPQGKGSQLHNRREYERIGKEIPSNIDASKTHENIVIVDKDIRKAYEDIFGESLSKYNEKQKRNDRKIIDYYDHISKSKNGEKLFYEDVIQWGSKDDFDKNPELKEKAKTALIEYANSFEDRNPNLKLIGAYVHMDEASPHLHLDYIPVAHNYSRGLDTRNSLDRAMKEMGFIPSNESRKNNATKLWKENERKYFASICERLELIVEVERAARGSLSVEEYKDIKDAMKNDIQRDLVIENKSLEVAIEKKEKKLEEVETLIAGRTQSYNKLVKDINALSRKKALEFKTYESVLEAPEIPVEKSKFSGKLIIAPNILDLCNKAVAFYKRYFKKVTEILSKEKKLDQELSRIDEMKRDAQTESKQIIHAAKSKANDIINAAVEQKSLEERIKEAEREAALHSLEKKLDGIETVFDNYPSVRKAYEVALDDMTKEQTKERGRSR